MSEWISKLERAKALLDAGALTNEEFETEKAKILAVAAQAVVGHNFEEQNSQILSQSDSADVTDEYLVEDSTPNSINPWIWAALAGSALIALVIYMVWPANTDNTQISDVNKTVSNAPEEFAMQPAEDPEPRQPVALDTTLKFLDSSLCIADGTLDKVYLKLDKAMETGGTGYTIKLDEFEKTLLVEALKKKDADGVETQSASVRFPGETSWHGLKLSRIKADWYLPPETDSSYSRSITFLESPERVQKVLSRLGFNALLYPDYSELPDTYNSCGGAMYIEAIPGGSSLNCGWGC